MRIINIKNTRKYKKLRDIVDNIEGLTLGVVKYNEGYNRLDGKKSKIRCGMESDDVIQIVDTEGKTFVDTYVSDFNKKEFKRMCKSIV
jgi:hypothetical protein